MHVRINITINNWRVKIHSRKNVSESGKLFIFERHLHTQIDTFWDTGPAVRIFRSDLGSVVICELLWCLWPPLVSAGRVEGAFGVWHTAAHDRRVAECHPLGGSPAATPTCDPNQKRLTARTPALLSVTRRLPHGVGQVGRDATLGSVSCHMLFVAAMCHYQLHRTLSCGEGWLTCRRDGSVVA